MPDRLLLPPSLSLPSSDGEEGHPITLLRSVFGDELVEDDRLRRLSSED